MHLNSKIAVSRPFFRIVDFISSEKYFFFWNTFIANRDLKMRRIEKKIKVEKSQF